MISSCRSEGGDWTLLPNPAILGRFARVQVLPSNQRPVSRRRAGTGARCRVHSDQLNTLRFGGDDQVVVLRGKWQFAPLGQLQVGSVVRTELVLQPKLEDFGVGLGKALVVELDSEPAQLAEKFLSALRTDTSLALCFQKDIDDFQPPQSGNPSFLAQRDSFQDSFRVGCSLRLKAPSHRYRGIQDETHIRPSSIKSLILRPPSDNPLRRSRIRAAAVWARRLRVSSASAMGASCVANVSRA